MDINETKYPELKKFGIPLGHKYGFWLPPYTLNPQPSTLNPQPSTLNPQPSTLNPQPSTLNTKP